MGLLNNTPQEYYNGNDFGGYQFISLTDVINQFMLIYVGEDKIIPRAKRLDVAFHAQRALAELSFDTFKSCKSQEIEVPATLQMTLPQDYVNYTKISWVDSAGIKHLMYPASKTSNPYNPKQNTDGEFKLKADATFTVGSRFIVLDKVYSELEVGMVVNSPHISSSTNIIGGITSDGTQTTLELANMVTLAAGFAYFNAEEAGTFTVQIEKSNGDLFSAITSSYTAENITATAESNFLTVSVADASNIEVGMIVAGQNVQYISNGTTVVAINGTSITMSNPMESSYPAGTAFDVNFISPISNSDTWDSYKSATPSENQDDYQDDVYWPMQGERYGLDPQHAQANGSFYIDCVTGKIHFSSNISGKTVILDYISDSLVTDEEMQVHKFAEEAMYRCILHAIASGRIQTQQIVPRLKKEKFAAVRQAKLRLSNIKLEELTQILRGKSKQIKH